MDPSGKTLGSLTPAVWRGALDRRTWDQLRAVLLNPERNTNVRVPSKRLLTGLIHCGVCNAALSSRPRDNHTKRYICAGRREGHQLAIVAEAAEDLVAGRVQKLLTTGSVRDALVRDSDPSGADDLGQVLSDLGSAHRRLRMLDDDYYVLGRLAESRYRSAKAKLEREIDRLQHLVDVATKQRLVLHPDPRAYWAGADIAQRRDLVRLVVERVTIRPGASRCSAIRSKSGHDGPHGARA